MPQATATLKLEPEMKERVKHLADAKQRSPHWVMKAAIEQYVEREEKREAFNREAVEAWEEYQATGLHVTHEEMITWLESWGTENELPPPECHT